MPSPLILLVLWPLAELTLIALAVHLLGLLPVLVLLALSWPLGWRIIRTRGTPRWRSAVAEMLTGGRAGPQTAEAALLTLAGLLLMVPGFIADSVGVLLLSKPGRSAAGRVLRRRRRSPGIAGAPRARSDYDFDATAVDADETGPDLRAPRMGA